MLRRSRQWQWRRLRRGGNSGGGGAVKGGWVGVWNKGDETTATTTTRTTLEETEYGIGRTRFLCFGQSKTVLGTLNIFFQGSSVTAAVRVASIDWGLLQSVLLARLEWMCPRQSVRVKPVVSV